MKAKETLIAIVSALAVILGMTGLPNMPDIKKLNPLPVAAGSIEACAPNYHGLQQENFLALADKVRSKKYQNDTQLLKDMELDRDTAHTGAYAPYRVRVDEAIGDGDMSKDENLVRIEKLLREIAAEHGRLK